VAFNISVTKSEPPPPPRNNPTGYRGEIVAKLKADPGEWYEIERPNHWGSNVKSDFRKQYPGIEAVMRRVDDAPRSANGNPRYRLWLRWVGESG
jgi:hypothetical protein